MKGKLDHGIVSAEIHVSQDLLHRPELLPLVLRNFVVDLSRKLSPDEHELFREYMKIVYGLEREFDI